MNRRWIDENLQILFDRLKDFNPAQHFFEPTLAIYERLQSGEDNDLQSVALDIATYLRMQPVPRARYDWGLKMEPEVAGQIRLASLSFTIQIPFFYAGKKYAVGSILAHEMTHAFLFSRGIWLENPEENEMLTDLAAVFIGLGKLLLNGLILETTEDSSLIHVIGYLSPELISYSCQKVNESRKSRLGHSSK